MPPTTLRPTWALLRRPVASFAPGIIKTPRPKQPMGGPGDDLDARIQAAEDDDDFALAEQLRAQKVKGQAAPVATPPPTPLPPQPPPPSGSVTQPWSGGTTPTTPTIGQGDASQLIPKLLTTEDEVKTYMAAGWAVTPGPYDTYRSTNTWKAIPPKSGATTSKTTYLPNNPSVAAVDPGTNRKGTVERGYYSGLPDWSTFVTSEPAPDGKQAIPNPTGYIPDGKGWLIPTYLNSDKNTVPTGGPMVKDEEYWIQKKQEADKALIEWKAQREAGTTTDYTSPDGGVWKVFTPSDGSEPKYTKVGQKPPVDNSIYTDAMRDEDFKFLIRDVGYNALFLEQLKTASVAQFRNLVNLEKAKFAQNTAAKNQLETTASALFDIPMDEQTKRLWSAAANAKASQQPRDTRTYTTMPRWSNSRQR